MFCPKCGNQVDDNAAFCPKCGNPFKRSSTKEVKKVPNKKGILLFMVLVLIAGIGIVALQPRTENEEKVAYDGVTNQMQLPVVDTSIKKTDYSITKLEVDEATVLDGEYPNLTEIISTGGDITLDGKFPVLSTITMNADENGNIGQFDFSEDASFPSLQVMNLNIENRHLNEDFKELLIYAIAMRDNGLVDEVHPNIMHDITDLYGTWITADGTFALTLRNDGKVRVADASNLLGVDVLSYREIDEDTLGLKAEGNNMLLNMVEIAMDYQLLGDELTVEFLEYQFQLIKEK